MNKLAPIVLFVFNRIEHTKQTIDNLKKNDLAIDSDLYVFSDAAKKDSQVETVNKVRDIISRIEGFKSVTVEYAQQNKGLGNSIIRGVTEIIEKYGKVIVLEDDIITSPFFLNYMNDALNYYEDNDDIWSISGYQFPIEIPEEYNKNVYFAYRSSSWGWATWKNRWKTIDWDVKDYKKYCRSPIKIHHFCKGGNNLDRMLRKQMNGKIDSWAIRWCYSQSLQNKYTVYPVVSFVTNIGTDGSGTHCDPTSARFNVKLTDDYDIKFENKIEFNKNILRNFKRLLDVSIRRKLKNIFSNLIYILINKRR